MQQISYNKIYGCPIHGSKHGIVTTLNYKNGKGEKTKNPCFKCDACMKVFLEPSSGDMGYTGKIVNGYSIWKVKGPIQLPNEIFVYDKKNKNNICSCSGTKKKKYKNISEFLLPSGGISTIQAKKCTKCKKTFISKGVYTQQKDIFDEYKLNVHFIGNDNDYSNTGNITENDKVEMGAIKNVLTSFYGEDWENAVFGDEKYEENVLDYENLLPANKVASAYYDAKIDYNPYQYLPWLKMFVNGTDELLISDEVGLGKTVEAGILIMQQLSENVNARILILCPAFLKEKWYQELNEKFLLDSLIYDGKHKIDTLNGIVIMPISRIGQYIDQSDFQQYSMVVIDEVHYFKNTKSIRYSKLKKLLSTTGKAKHIFMSATPVNNSGNDYHAIEALFDGKPEKTNTTKKQAYIYLPERKIKDVYIELSAEEQKFYDVTDDLDPFAGTVYRHIGASCLYALGKYAFSGDELVSETKEELRYSLEELVIEMDDNEALEKCFSVIKKIVLPSTDSKLLQARKIIRSYAEGTKIVIFSHYIETIKYLFSELSDTFNVGYIYANTISNNIICQNKKNKFIDAKKWFTNSKNKTTILICSDSCREGIDLDIANILINYDLPFNPSIMEQRIGRIDRMSQKKDMEIYNFHVNNTYDDRLHFILSAKLRFINYYADYGIGNPLNITSEGDCVFDGFIKYFGQKIQGIKDYAQMSNDDYSVVARVLKQIGIKLEKRKDIDALKMQAILLDRLKENQRSIEAWFNRGEIKEITEAQLLKQRDELEKTLGFPERVQRRLILNNLVKKSIVDKANTNAQFRRRISTLINNYAEKVVEMEITGLPMKISVDDLKTIYDFGGNNVDALIQSSVIELLRNEGADVYEIK